jgi:transcriptional regulator with XRE-family HTH domain
MEHNNAYRRAVGQRIARFRRSAHLTHAQLAERLGWPRDTLIHYEHGRRALSVDRLEAIAKALDVHPAVLITIDDGFAAIVQRLAGDPEIRAQVQFFLDTLEE